MLPYWYSPWSLYGTVLLIRFKTSAFSVQPTGWILSRWHNAVCTTTWYVPYSPQVVCHNEYSESSKRIVLMGWNLDIIGHDSWRGWWNLAHHWGFTWIRLGCKYHVNALKLSLGDVSVQVSQGTSGISGGRLVVVWRPSARSESLSWVALLPTQRYRFSCSSSFTNSNVCQGSHKSLNDFVT